MLGMKNLERYLALGARIVGAINRALCAHTEYLDTIITRDGR
jgi:hypothetical protein